MSEQQQDHRPRPRPLHERSQSQNNKLGIRIVPYTPPRIAFTSRVPNRNSASQENLLGEGGEDETRSPHKSSYVYFSEGVSSSPKAGGAVKDELDRPDLGVSTASTASLPLARSTDGGVSGSRTTISGPTLGATSTLVLRTPFDNNPSSMTTDVNVPTQQHGQPAQHDGAASISPSPSPSLSPSSPSSRVLSRRRNIINLHADKTFSIVLQNTSGTARDDPRILTSTTFETLSSHGRLSDAFTDDVADSSLATVATIPDRSLPLCTPSPTLSPIQQVTAPIGASPWNYPLVGGVRQVVQTPDTKQKQPVRPTSGEPPFDPLPDSPVLDDTWSPTLIPKPSFASGQTDRTASETTNYKIYGPRSPVQEASSSSENLAASLPSLPSRPSSSHFGDTTNLQILGVSSPQLAPVSSSRPPSGCSFSTNVQILGVSSPPLVPVSSSRPPSVYSFSTNVQILGISSPPATYDSSRPATSDSEKFALYGDSAPSSPLVIISRRQYPTYSQESLIVPPLKPGKRQSLRSRSKETLRRANSARSTRSISSIISQEVGQSFLSASTVINPRRNSYHGTPSQTYDSGGSGTSAASDLSQPPRLPMLEPQPHVWSSQLSTIGSETEDLSSRGGSRVISLASGPDSAVPGRRRSSAGWASSTHSRQMLSISSSLAQQLDEGSPRSPASPRSHSRSRSLSDSLERPQQVLTRGSLGNSVRMVRDQDEHGDGLADLEDVSNRPSRSGLSAFFGTSSSSDRNLDSSASSRTGSFKNSTIPSWARLYYGAGEARRLLNMPSMSSINENNRPSSSWRTGSPNPDNFPPTLYSPRKRPRDAQGPTSQLASDTGLPEITPVTPTHQHQHRRQRQLSRQSAPPGSADRAGEGIVGYVRKKTSSVWSPHLRVDRRSTGRFSMWEPPSVTWSAEGAVTGRRNIQVVAFILGFIFPLSWMIAAVLPLPPVPPEQDPIEMAERGHHGQSQFGGSHKLEQYPGTIDELRYHSAKWWRTLNRAMSVVGLLLIGAVIALVVLGVKNGWR